nr:Periplasmic copper-binding protein (NosD) [Candidatus Prometheoarchaeum syntrophicum]
MIGIEVIFIGVIIMANLIEVNNPITNTNDQKLLDSNLIIKNEEEFLSENDKETINNAPISAIGDDPISISGNVALAAFCTHGSGIPGDPYIIEGYEIDASTAHGICIDNTDAYLTIQNCIIENGSFIDDNYFFGIHLFSCSNVKIFNNTVSNNNNEGIRIYDSNHITISGNNCSNNGMTQIVGFITNDGILLESSDYNTVSNNTCLSNFNDGIGLQRSNFNTVVGNNCSFNNKEGIEVESSNYTIITENFFLNNLEDQANSFDSNNNQWYNNSNSIGNYWGDYRVRYPGATNDGIIWDTPYEITAGVFDEYPLVMNDGESNTPIVAEIHAPIAINGNAELASFCSEGSGTSNDPYIIEGYKIDASTAHGIVIDHTDAYLIIRDCIIENGSFINDNYFYGIYLFSCSNVKIMNNIVANNNNEGIRLYLSNYNTISGNYCSNNGMTQTVGFITNDGILLESSDYNIVSNNTCLNNFNDGIGLQRSNYNTVVGNNCSFNNKEGIELESSNNTTITENYFINNQENQANSFDSNNNQWDNGSIGNYWGDYEVRYPDATNNGVVWDTPYEIAAGIFDEYPLVMNDGENTGNNGPFSGFNIPGYPMEVFLAIFAISTIGIIISSKKHR